MVHDFTLSFLCNYEITSFWPIRYPNTEAQECSDQVLGGNQCIPGYYFLGSDNIMYRGSIIDLGTCIRIGVYTVQSSIAHHHMHKLIIIQLGHWFTALMIICTDCKQCTCCLI